MWPKLHGLDYAQKVYGFLPALCAAGRTAYDWSSARLHIWRLLAPLMASDSHGAAFQRRPRQAALISVFGSLPWLETLT